MPILPLEYITDTIRPFQIDLLFPIKGLVHFQAKSKKVFYVIVNWWQNPSFIHIDDIQMALFSEAKHFIENIL